MRFSSGNRAKHVELVEQGVGGIDDRFYRMAFGTGGMRGAVGRVSSSVELNLEAQMWFPALLQGTNG